MLSRLTQATIQRDDGTSATLTDLEIIGFAGLLGGAGAETVTKLIGNAIVLFHRNPGQWQRVVDDPGSIPKAVEEILRYFRPRNTRADTPWRNAPSREAGSLPGSPCCSSPARRLRSADVRRPDDFDIDRPSSVAIGFGHGVHSCLGAALARMESRIAIEEFLKRWPRFDVDEAGLRRVQMSNVAGYQNVPVRVPSPTRSRT